MPGPIGSGEIPIDEGGVAAAGDTGRGVSPDELLRRRAEEAEERAAAAEARVAELQAALEAERGQAAQAERRREIERCCAEADAVDAPTVALLTELAVAQMDEPDVAAALADLRRSKPFLFRAAVPGPAPGAMSAAAEPAGGEGLAELAERARATGDRRALLAYLRRRRLG